MKKKKKEPTVTRKGITTPLRNQRRQRDATDKKKKNARETANVTRTGISDAPRSRPK